MKHSTRRRWDTFLLGGSAVVIGAAATIGALAGDTERIGNYWTHAAIADDGRAQVVEVIDYDFGPLRRHGILRNIPDVDPRSHIAVSSPTAPDAVEISAGFGETNLRIGDPAKLIHDRHRYQISYPIDTLVVGDRVSWNAVGLSWPVPINNVEIHVTASREFANLVCHQGPLGAQGGCDVTQIAPGHLLVQSNGLSSLEAVTVEGTLGAELETIPTTPVAPDGAAEDPGSGWLAPGLGSLGAAVLAGGVTSRRLRNLGREQVWRGGAADAAFGPPSGTVVGFELLDHEELAQMATIEFASPQGLSAAAGGIIHAEKVTSEHQMAWLIECAIRNEIVLVEDGDDLSLTRGSAVPHPVVVAKLDAIFGETDRVELGKYNSSFATAWTSLATDLEEWRVTSGLWDPKGHRRRSSARIFGSLAAIFGLALVVVGGVIANRAGLNWIALSLGGAVVAGVGIAAVLRSWELPIRTPEGSGRWLQIESFRRFIAGSEARHAEAAARMGLLRQYTAWAVALGELDHWQNSVEAAAAVPGSSAIGSAADYHFVTMAPALSAATTQTFTSPSSSGGGGGGGGAGGGGGGGGGGSW